MLPRKNRLSRRDILSLLEKKSRPLSGENFGLIYVEDKFEEKVGVLVSNRVSNKAFLRNKIKRIIFRLWGEMKIKKNGKYLFLAKRNSVNCDLDSFRKDLFYFIEKTSK